MSLAIVPHMPDWIKADLFEPVFREILDDFKRIKDFKVVPAVSAGENIATVILRLEAEIELKDQPYLLLEDLKPKGFNMFNRLQGFDVEHTKAVLSILAKWHAASATLYPTKDKCPEIFLKSFFEGENSEIMKKIGDSIQTAFLKCAENYENQELYYESLKKHYMNNDADKDAEDIKDAKGGQENEFNVLNHGDCWSNNIMFQYDDLGNISDVHLIDYQCPRYGPPAQDLYYVLLSSTHYDIKVKKFEYFVKYYHDCLIENLKLLRYPKKIPSLRDLHIMLHIHNFWAFNVCTGVMAAVLADPSDDANVDNYFSDSDEAKQFKIKLFSNPRYRKHIEMLLPWLQYRGVF